MQPSWLGLHLFISCIIYMPNASSTTPGPTSSVKQQDIQPNIILFFIDDMEFTQSLSMYGPIGNTYYDLPTPNINAFMNESVLFTTSYCGAPICTPSRFSLLTGRQASRSEWGNFVAQKTSTEYYGARVSIVTSKLYDDDTIFNMPYVLQNDVNNPYYTGMVGKWHLTQDIEYDALNYGHNATLYTKLSAEIKTGGFNFVNALYEGNIKETADFSHNPEWMLSESQRFIERAVDVEQKPFFLYFAPTLTHSPSAVDALLNFSMAQTPKGTLSGGAIPDTTMLNRDSIYQEITSLVSNVTLQDTAAAYYWIDNCFGALIEYLKGKDLYDNTFIVLMSDQGMTAKNLLYQGGSRTFQFVRYPPLFGDNGPYIIPSDFVVSFVDLAPTIFELTGIEPSDTYKLDGTSWLTDVQMQINNNDIEQTCCHYRYIDVEHSHTIVSSNYQYIYRADHTYKDTAVTTGTFPYYNDEEQLYDLLLDPTQQVNLINDMSLATTIVIFQELMRQYIQDICPIDECKMPNISFTMDPTSEPSISPTQAQSISPTSTPLTFPTPSTLPTQAPSLIPTQAPSVIPTLTPSTLPTQGPSLTPTLAPSTFPTQAPSVIPTLTPSILPTQSPTLSIEPSISPASTTSIVPSSAPSMSPTSTPLTFPTQAPSVFPTLTPSTLPTQSPTLSIEPSISPTSTTSMVPTSTIPTQSPSVSPTLTPSTSPISTPSMSPTSSPKKQKGPKGKGNNKFSLTGNDGAWMKTGAWVYIVIASCVLCVILVIAFVRYKYRHKYRTRFEKVKDDDTNLTSTEITQKIVSADSRRNIELMDSTRNIELVDSDIELY